MVEEMEKEGDAGRAAPKRDLVKAYIPLRKRELLDPLVLGDVGLTGHNLEIRLYLTELAETAATEYIHRLEQAYAGIARAIFPQYLEFLTKFLNNVPSQGVRTVTGWF